jgi:hypothetical protein
MRSKSNKAKQRKINYSKIRENAIDRVAAAGSIEMAAVLQKHLQQRLLEQQAYSYDDK